MKISLVPSRKSEVMSLNLRVILVAAKNPLKPVALRFQMLHCIQHDSNEKIPLC